MACHLHGSTGTAVPARGGLGNESVTIMGETNNQRIDPQDVIAAFDREREAAQELNRRHAEHVRNSRRDDQQILVERGRRTR